jgi:transcriptional regulator with XRE-family HTH domain
LPQRRFLQKIIINNLKEFLIKIGIPTSKEASEFLNINYSTYRSWMALEREPSLRTLDNICDKLQIPTYVLFMNEKCIDYKGYHVADIKNDSRMILVENLKRVYADKGKQSWHEKESLFYGLLSQETLKSYQRNKEYICPTIQTIEGMCSYLGIPAYKLLSGGSYESEN